MEGILHPGKALQGPAWFHLNLSSSLLPSLLPFRPSFPPFCSLTKHFLKPVEMWLGRWGWGGKHQDEQLFLGPIIH